jgi:hypothetical protein
MVMKDDSERDYADRMDAKIKVWTAQVEVAKVKFSKSPNLGIDFQNEIDAWNRMEFIFRQQIKQLRSSVGPDKTNLKSSTRRGYKDLKTLVYSIREKID